MMVVVVKPLVDEKVTHKNELGNVGGDKDGFDGGGSNIDSTPLMANKRLRSGKVHAYNPCKA